MNISFLRKPFGLITEMPSLLGLKSSPRMMMEEWHSGLRMRLKEEG
jgi:hypothetical protein